MVFLIDQSVIFASPGRVARIVADKRVAASPKFFWVPDDRVQMAGIEMGLGSVPFLLTASVDDRAAQTFGKSRLPIGAIVIMGEIGDHES
jgi:hypothetical protein